MKTARSPFLPAAVGSAPPLLYWDEVALDAGRATLRVVVETDGEAVVGLTFAGQKRPARREPPGAEMRREPAAVAEAAKQLHAYAAGELRTFDLPLRLRGTAYQLQVWSALMAVPYGTTTTYGALAASIGRPGGGRAVGAAVGANPIGIVVPCHRVIGSDGTLTGYAGGLANKTALLRLEGITAL